VEGTVYIYIIATNISFFFTKTATMNNKKTATNVDMEVDRDLFEYDRDMEKAKNTVAKFKTLANEAQKIADEAMDNGTDTATCEELLNAANRKWNTLYTTVDNMARRFPYESCFETQDPQTKRQVMATVDTKKATKPVGPREQELPFLVIMKNPREFLERFENKMELYDLNIVEDYPRYLKLCISRMYRDYLNAQTRADEAEGKDVTWDMIKGHILNFTNTAKLRVRNVSD
jgi:hypothetical protein